MLKYFRVVYKFLLFSFVIIAFFISAFVCYVFNLNAFKRRKALIRNTQIYCLLLSKLFSVKIICKNPITADEHSLVVGNHLGFIDVMAAQSIQPCVFVTSLDMKRTPILGQIADLAGCAYVDRQNRANIELELKELIEVLKSGFRLGLYPEAMASNGEQVLPFKKTLLQAAGYAGRPIRPYVFNITKVNDRPVRFEDRDYVCWYGDQSFLESICRTFQLKSIECEIEFLPLVYVQVGDDRTQVSEGLRSSIVAKFKPFFVGMNQSP